MDPAEEMKKSILKKFKNSEKIQPEKNQKLSEIDNKWNMYNKILKLYIENMEKDQELKGKYATILIIILAFMLIALIIIFILKGCGILEYSDTTFNIFITAGIAEVFVLVRIIVEYLFKDNLTNALNIILTNNKSNYKKGNVNKKNNINNSDKP